MKQLQIFKSGRQAISLFLRTAFLLLVIAAALPASGQNNGEKLISMQIKNQTLGNALREFSKVSGYKVNFSSEDVSSYKVNVEINQVETLKVLEKIIENKPFDYEVSGKIISIRKRKENTKKVVNSYRLIEGIVVDENGSPLPGANVHSANSRFGAISDAEGKFRCRVLTDAKYIEISFVGMNTEKIDIKDKSSIKVVMHENQNQLEAVVVTGYQKISKERATGSFGFVDSKEMEKQNHESLSSSLEGKISGLRLDINPNTGDASPIIRGIGTLSNDVGTNPLIVVDNMPTNLTLNDINPYNVESVTVLKDAAATSIYGALAANGVIVITTKQAEQTGSHIRINADWFITSKPSFKSLDLASTSDIIDYQSDVLKARAEESGSIADFLSSYKSSYYNPLFQLYADQESGKISDSELNATLNEWRKNDYYKEYRDNAWRTAVTQRYNVSISQKAGENNHFLSVNYEKLNNRVITSNSNKISLYYKSHYSINKWVDVNAGADVRIGNRFSPNSSYTNYSLQQRYERILNADGSHYISPTTKLGGYSGGSYNGDIVSQAEGVAPYKSFGFNVLDALNESKTKSNDVSIRPFLDFQVKFLKMFKYNMMYQYEWNNSKSKVFDDKDSYIMRLTHNSMIDTNGKAMLPDGGRYFQSELTSKRYTFRNQVDFDKRWNKNSVTAIMGLEFRENKIPIGTQQLLYGYDPQTLTSDIIDWQAYREGVGTSALSGTSITMTGLPATQKEARHRYASFYGNAAYSYMSRYNISGSIRWDEADLFGLDIRNQHHPLWSVGASWLVSEENFMKDLSWMNYLKLRMTYGLNGNVDQSSTTFFVVKQKTQSNPIKSTYLTYEDDDLPNPKLRWEKTATYNVGVDFRFFDNILTGSIDYYNRYASDLLVRRFMDPTMGARSRVVNNGEMRNRGIEISLSADIIRKKDWNFTAGWNFAYNKNKMTKVDHSDSDEAISFILSPQNYFMQGTSYNTLWAYRIDRIENGYPVAVDKDGKDLVSFNEDGTVKEITSSYQLKGTDDLRNMGTLTPKYNGSVSLKLSYKNFDVNALIIYSGGNKMRKCVTNMNDAAGSETNNNINNRWNASAPDKNVRMYMDMPSSVKTYAGTFQYWWQYGDNNVIDAGYAKLRSLSLGYNLPSSLCKRMSISSLKLKLQVNNLLTWSKAGNGIDPESYSLNSGTRGIASPKTYSIGFSTSF